MTINVTAEDIALGCRHHAGKCPIARALNRVYGHVWVGSFSWCIKGATRHKRLPDEAADFIITFDNTGRALPFSFEVPDDRPDSQPDTQPVEVEVQDEELVLA